MTILENDFLQVSVHNHGAEMQRLYHKQYRLDYLWNGDPAFWGRFSPVLFPIVGTLVNNTYYYNGKEYQLPRHGFARDREFQLEQADDTTATFSLSSDAATRIIYPFDFMLRLQYSLHDASLEVKYIIENAGKDPLYFSIGGHPAFRVPLVHATNYDDYYLLFNHRETLNRLLINHNLIDTKQQTFLHEENKILLTHQLFYDDAIILKNPRSSFISLKNDKINHGINLYFGDFPYLGLWSAKDADFVCIEPWQGIADSVQHNQQLTEKDGILRLAGGEKIEKTWQVECF